MIDLNVELVTLNLMTTDVIKSATLNSWADRVLESHGTMILSMNNKAEHENVQHSGSVPHCF